jgi:hypothetical protein
MFSPLRFKFVATFMLSLVAFISFAQCKKIDVDVKVVKTSSDINSNRSIILEIKESNKSFQVSLFGPDKNNILNSAQTEFKNLASGNYLIVVVSKRDDDNYCPKSLNVTIN